MNKNLVEVFNKIPNQYNEKHVQCPSCADANGVCFSHFVEQFNFISDDDDYYATKITSTKGDLSAKSINVKAFRDKNVGYRIRELSTATIYSCEISGEEWCMANMFHKGRYYTSSFNIGGSNE